MLPLYVPDCDVETTDTNEQPANGVSHRAPSSSEEARCSAGDMHCSPGRMRERSRDRSRDRSRERRRKRKAGTDAHERHRSPSHERDADWSALLCFPWPGGNVLDLQRITCLKPRPYVSVACYWAPHTCALHKSCEELMRQGQPVSWSQGHGTGVRQQLARGVVMAWELGQLS